MYKELMERLAKHYVIDGQLHPSFAEEFCDKDGTLDYRYISRKYKHPWTSIEAKRLITEYFGSLKFKVDKPFNEVSEELFNEHYEFGRFPDVRGWITWFWENHSKILTRERLYELVYTRN